MEAFIRIMVYSRAQETASIHAPKQILVVAGDRHQEQSFLVLVNRFFRDSMFLTSFQDLIHAPIDLRVLLVSGHTGRFRVDPAAQVFHHRLCFRRPPRVRRIFMDRGHVTQYGPHDSPLRLNRILFREE